MMYKCFFCAPRSVDNTLKLSLNFLQKRQLDSTILRCPIVDCFFPPQDCPVALVAGTIHIGGLECPGCPRCPVPINEWKMKRAVIQDLVSICWLGHVCHILTCKNAVILFESEIVLVWVSVLAVTHTHSEIKNVKKKPPFAVINWYESLK